MSARLSAVAADVHNAASEAHAFASNASSVVAAIVADAEILERTEASFQLKAIRARGRQLTRLAYVVSDQIERAETLLADIVERVSLVSAGSPEPAPAANGSSTAAFDLAIRQHREIREAALSESQTGALRRAYDLHQAGGLIEDVTAAEDRYFAEFTKPRYDALSAVLAVPAPSLAALLTKLNLVELEELDDHEELIAFVRSDVRRLAEEGR